MLAAVVWWQWQPSPVGPAPGTGLADLDAVCLGRVDGLRPAAALEPAIPGRVVKVSVQEGDSVQAGQELLRLDDTALQLKADEARAAVRLADLDLEAAEREATTYPARIAARDAAVEAFGKRVAAAKQVFEQRKVQQTFGQISAAEIAAADAEVRQIEQLQLAEVIRRDELRRTDPRLQVRVAVAKKAAALVAVQLAERAANDCVLTAPSAGVILRVHASEGETVAPGTPQPPIVFRPQGPLVVRAELDQEFLGRVREKMRATIRDDARADSPTWTGTVLRVGNYVAHRRAMVLEPGEVSDVRTVECVIGVDPSPEPLLVGQRVRVRIGKGE
jgi:multidrug resistance efflux pump